VTLVRFIADESPSEVIPVKAYQLACELPWSQNKATDVIEEPPFYGFKSE
jgi:hypothetical protein